MMCTDGLQAIYEELKNDQHELRKLKEKRDERYASIFPGAIDYSREKVQTSANNPMEGWMADLDSMDKTIDAMEKAILEKKELYVKELGLDKEPVIKTHYIDLVPWGKVGATLGIARKTVYNRRKRYFEKARQQEKTKEKQRNKENT